MADLNEVIIKPTKETKQSLQKAKEMFPNKEIRTLILRDYDTWGIDELGNSQSDAISRLYDLYKLSGRPKLVKRNSVVMGGREHYNPINNTVYLPDPTFDGYVEELSHAYQNSSGAFSKGKIGLDMFFHPDQWINNASPVHNDEIYNRVGGYEHLAHKVISPLMWDYISK